MEHQDFPLAWGICGETPFLNLNTDSGNREGSRTAARMVLAQGNRPPQLGRKRGGCPTCQASRRRIHRATCGNPWHKRLP